MPIIFNGNVTIHGNVEMYDNGSMKRSNPKEGRFEKAMGGWKGIIDCEQLIKDIYESRRLSTKRPEVKYQLKNDNYDPKNGRN